eukprot:scaffold4501_cov395-Prasinococcus_capsulatus_cf.AAC.21
MWVERQRPSRPPGGSWSRRCARGCCARPCRTHAPPPPRCRRSPATAARCVSGRGSPRPTCPMVAASRRDSDSHLRRTRHQLGALQHSRDGRDRLARPRSCATAGADAALTWAVEAVIVVVGMGTSPAALAAAELTALALGVGTASGPIGPLHVGCDTLAPPSLRQHAHLHVRFVL